MKTKKLGQLDVSVLCLGGNVFGWTIDEKTSFAVLDAYVAAGGNFIDTANVYSRWAPGHSGGESETILGKWMKARGNRKQIVLTTKVGMEMGPDQMGLKRDYILRAAEESLQRLQTDYIDLYLSHQPDPTTPIGETMEAYTELVKQGKVRVVGGSNYHGHGLTEAIETSRARGLVAYQSLQPLYNLYDRAEFERDLEPVCEKYGVAVTPYYALAAGFLTGKYRSLADVGQSARGTKVGANYLNDRGFKILAALDEVAAAQGTTPAVVAFAWLLTRPIVTAPIASATSVEQLRSLIDGTKLTLSPDSLAALDKASTVLERPV